MPTRDPKLPQTLEPPKTRITQAWQASWQAFRGEAPRKLIRVQSVIVPNMARLAYKHRVRR